MHHLVGRPASPGVRISAYEGAMQPATLRVRSTYEAAVTKTHALTSAFPRCLLSAAAAVEVAR
ncbi:hypothetical protein SABIM44S_00046 [Streptomyces abikoensis]